MLSIYRDMITVANYSIFYISILFYDSMLLKCFDIFKQEIIAVCQQFEGNL